MATNKRAQNGSIEAPETYTFRVVDIDHRKKLASKLKEEKKKLNRPSMSNTIESLLLKHFDIIN